MSSFAIKGPSAGISGTLFLPGDKSIAHRCVILGALASGVTAIRNFPLNSDCLSTIAVFKKLGVRIRRNGDCVLVCGKGLRGLRPARVPILIPESGTTFRLMMGVLAGQTFASTLAAGKQLSRRPMLRVAEPLRSMGADVSGRKRGGGEYPPVLIRGGALSSIRYVMPVASAQVKSAILLAGLYAPGVTAVVEKTKSRDHTERLMELFGARIRTAGKTVRIRGGKELVSPGEVRVPGDISSAAFFIVLASIIPGSCLRIRGVSLNGTRTGIISVLRRMGADLEVTALGKGPEPAGDIRVKAACLKGTVVEEKEIPRLIDELPVLMVAAACARGETVFRGAGELRVKETDRIRSMLASLRKMGVHCRAVKTGKREDVIISGVSGLSGAVVDSFGDHRTAMSLTVAGASARGTTVIKGIECINKSFPGFLREFRRLLK